MSKGWVIFLGTVGILVLILTGLQVMFALTPDKNLNVYNPNKIDPNFQVEVLQKIYDNQKWVLINNDTLEPNVIQPFTPPTTSTGQ